MSSASPETVAKHCARARRYLAEQAAVCSSAEARVALADALAALTTLASVLRSDARTTGEVSSAAALLHLDPSEEWADDGIRSGRVVGGESR